MWRSLSTCWSAPPTVTTSSSEARNPRRHSLRTKSSADVAGVVGHERDRAARRAERLDRLDGARRGLVADPDAAVEVEQEEVVGARRVGRAARARTLTPKLPRRCCAHSSSRSCLALALGLAACGDNEEDVRRVGGTGTETAAADDRAPRPTAAEPASGCRKVEEPEAAKRKVDEARRRARRLARPGPRSSKTSCGTIEIALDVKENPKTASSFAAPRARGLLRRPRRSTASSPASSSRAATRENTGQGGPGYSVVEAPPREPEVHPRRRRDGQDRARGPGHVGQPVLHRHRRGRRPARPTTRSPARSRKGDDVVELLANVPNDPADNRPTEPVVIEESRPRVVVALPGARRDARGVGSRGARTSRHSPRAEGVRHAALTSIPSVDCASL